jgi:hypothetical protein
MWDCGSGLKEQNAAKLFWMERVCLLWAESVRADAASESVVDLNKMFFWGNCLRPFNIQTVVHLRSTASQSRSK